MDKRAPRADALRNYQRILAAARQAFARGGVDVPLDAIAEAAGVGPGTVHRHFPTKEVLLAAVIADGLDVLASRAMQRHDDPTADFFNFLTEVVDTGRHNLALSAALNGPLGRIEESAGRLAAALQTLLEAAQRSGGVRADINVNDVHAVITGVLATESRLVESRRGLGLEIAIAGLRASTSK